MGIKYRADSEKQVIFVAWDGMVTADVWFEHIDRLIADPLWSSISAMLIDLRTVTDISSIEEAEIEHAVALFSTVPIPLSKKRVGVMASGAFWKSRRFGHVSPTARSGAPLRSPAKFLFSCPSPWDGRQA